MVEHIKRTWKAGCVYSMPASSFDVARLGTGVAELTTLKNKQLRNGAPMDASQLSRIVGFQGLRAYGDDELECHDDAMHADEGREITFSIVDPRPSKARVIPLPPGAADRLGPDDIQIAIHPTPSPGIMSVGVQVVAANPVMVLSRFGADIAAGV